MSHDTNKIGADLARDSEVRRHNAASSFEPISASLDMLEKMNDEHTQLVKAQIQHIRSEIERRVNAIAESSLTDPNHINIQLMQIDGLYYLPCFTDGSSMEPPNSARKHFGGGVFFGTNCPHNAEIQMDGSVRDILAAEMASIARSLEIAHLVPCSHAQNLLLVVDNLQAVMLTQTIVDKGGDGSNSGLLAGVLNSDRSIQNSIDIIIANKDRWNDIQVRHVNSHTGRTDAFARGNQSADDLATSACRKSFTNYTNLQ